LRALEKDYEQEDNEHYGNTMKIKKDEHFEGLANERFKLEIDLTEKLIENKDKEIKTFKEERDKINVKFQSDKEL